jgi:hypothetical protein
MADIELARGEWNSSRAAAVAASELGSCVSKLAGACSEWRDLRGAMCNVQYVV